MRRIILACALAGILSVSAFGQGVDPLIGTWKLNPEKSTYVGTVPPKSQTLTFTGEGRNFIDTVEGVDAQGQPFKLVFQHIYDGMPHQLTGSPDYDSTTFTRTGNTISSVRFKNGKTVVVSQMQIVPGKTITLVTGGINVNNQPFYTVTVMDRQ
jgi:hypothetical protein